MAHVMRSINVILPIVSALLFSIAADAQNLDTLSERNGIRKDSAAMSERVDSIGYFPHRIANVLPSDLFIPADRMWGLTPWLGGPVTRPVVHVIPVYGFSGYSFGKFTVDHWDRFFSNLLSYNQINVPQVVDSQVMLLGNTLSLGKKRKWFFTSGLLYGRHYGVWGNMLGMGSREGLIYRPNGYMMFMIWSQEYQSVYAYSPVVYAYPGEGTAATKLPASPLMVSYGAQAYFLAGQFWIGIGASFWNAEPIH